MPGGGHRFEFVGKEPPVFLAAIGLLFVNTFVLLLLAFGAKYVLPKASLNSPPCEALAANGVQYHAPGIVCWYAGHSIAIQFVILAVLAAIFVVFRKRVHYIPPR
jgi:hypothetical protein